MEMVSLRRTSSSEWSRTELPSSTRPSLGVAPARKSMDSASEVLPTPPWERSARFRICDVVNSFNRHLPEISVGWGAQAAKRWQQPKLARDFREGQAKRAASGYGCHRPFSRL